MDDISLSNELKLEGFLEEHKKSLNSEIASSVITASSDIVLLLGKDGRINALAHSLKDLTFAIDDNWIGQSWVDTVTIESRQKIVELLEGARSSSAPRWRQVNHSFPDNPDLPVRYIALPFGKKGQSLVLGQEMRKTAELQQELVRAQQGMEREYMRLRHAETRYRALFQIASESVLIVDAANNKIVDANPSAISLMETTAGELIGKSFPDAIGFEDNSKVTELLASVRRTGKTTAENVKIVSKSIGNCSVSLSLFRQGNTAHFLARIIPLEGGHSELRSNDHSRMIDVIESMPEGFVVTTPEGRILAVNNGFLDLAQLPTKDVAVGESITRWVGRSDFDTKALLGNIVDHGVARLFSTSINGELGSKEEVEISGVSVLDVPEPCLGLSIRSVSTKRRESRAKTVPGPRSVEQLTELVGQVSLKELVREATEMIERLSIEAALQLTGDNRASAAELLGVSRQSLYAKLHRYGLGDLPNTPENNSIN